MRKIGIFGGTFDPVHNAHIAIAEAAVEKLGLDFVIMMTGGNPPHKRGRDILDAKIRHIMLKRAVKGREDLIACDWETKRTDYSYTVNTLRFFKKIYPEDKLYFIIGGDSLDYIHEWREPENICKMCTLAVYSRGGEHNYAFVRERFDAEIEVIEGEFLDISSTALRENPAQMRKYVPEPAAELIEKYRLYMPREDDIEILQALISPQRLRHSIGVAELAKKLAAVYGEDEGIMYRAGLLHDAAKDIPYDEALVMCGELEAELDPLERTMPPLVHPKLGAELIKCLFGVKEGVITSAVRCHTVGKPGMSTADKIIFIADMCEESRSFPGVEDIRCAAFDNLDRACVMCINSTIEFNRRKGAFVHPMAYIVKKELEQNL